MVRLSDLPEAEQETLLGLDCHGVENPAWVVPPPLGECRVAMISTAGLHRRDDRPFQGGAVDYRVIPGDTPARDVVMSHISTSYDRTGFQQDINVVLPIDRLNELAADGVIGSVGRYHYSFMGATDPELMEPTTRHLAGLLKADKVDAVLLLPV